MHPSRASEPFNEQEIGGQSVELLPQRSALSSIVHLNIVTAVPVNIGIAVNAATFHSTAAVTAWQGTALG